MSRKSTNMRIFSIGYYLVARYDWCGMYHDARFDWNGQRTQLHSQLLQHNMHLSWPLIIFRSLEYILLVGYVSVLVSWETWFSFRKGIRSIAANTKGIGVSPSWFSASERQNILNEAPEVFSCLEMTAVEDTENSILDNIQVLEAIVQHSRFTSRAIKNTPTKQIWKIRQFGLWNCPESMKMRKPCTLSWHNVTRVIQQKRNATGHTAKAHKGLWMICN